MKVDAITGRNDEAIMNFEKVKKDASGANVRESLFLEPNNFMVLDFTG